MLLYPFEYYNVLVEYIIEGFTLSDTIFIKKIVCKVWIVSTPIILLKREFIQKAIAPIIEMIRYKYDII
jgi:hypothetical protein